MVKDEIESRNSEVTEMIYYNGKWITQASASLELGLKLYIYRGMHVGSYCTYPVVIVKGPKCKIYRMFESQQLSVIQICINF